MARVPLVSRRHAVVALFLAYAWTDAQRVQVWHDPVALWQDAIRHAPCVARPWLNLAQAYGHVNNPSAVDAWAIGWRIAEAGGCVPAGPRFVVEQQDDVLTVWLNLDPTRPFVVTAEALGDGTVRLREGDTVRGVRLLHASDPKWTNAALGLAFEAFGWGGALPLAAVRRFRAERGLQ